MEILFLTDSDSNDIEIIASQAPEGVHIHHLRRESVDEAIQRAAEFEVVIGGRIPTDLLERATNLRYLVIPYAGVPEMDRLNLLHYPDIALLNSHYNTLPAAEHAWALVLAAAKRIPHFDRDLRQGNWSGRYEQDLSVLLAGKTLLLIGYGAIGLQLAEIGKAFKMRVQAIKRTPGSAPQLDRLGTADDLHTFLPDADVIVISLPGTEQTIDFIDQEAFAKMRDGVIFVNVGRGPVVNEDAFYEAMKSGKIGGAGIDTWWVYPSQVNERANTSPSHHPLDQFDQLVMSPHRAAHVTDRGEAWVKDMGAIIRSIAAGKPINVVDRTHWY